jgi:hypothetical protein
MKPHRGHTSEFQENKFLQRYEQQREQQQQRKKSRKQLMIEAALKGVFKENVFKEPAKNE